LLVLASLAQSLAASQDRFNSAGISVLPIRLVSLAHSLAASQDRLSSVTHDSI